MLKALCLCLLFAALSAAIPLDRPYCTTTNGLFPHPKRCDYFYHCIKGIPQQKQCPVGLHFNKELLACDYPEHAKCTIDDPEKEEGECKEMNGIQAHPTDCHKYIHCIDGEPHARSCPDGLVFNKAAKSCDYPENTDCDGDKDDGDKDEGDKDLSHLCPVDQIMIKPHPTDCRLYIQCVKGVAFKRECPDGLAFNPKIQNCDYKENVNCDGDDETKPPECPKSNGLHAVFLEHEKSCHQYYICNHGQAVLQTCPANLYFNPKMDVCDYPENVKCSRGKNKDKTQVDFLKMKCPANDGKEQIFYRHPLECDMFFVCDNGKLTLQRCPSSLAFNEDKGICDHRRNVRC